MLIKKTTNIEKNPKNYSEKCVQLYNNIKEYAEAGYSMRAIAKILHCSRNTIKKYLNGDFEALCRKNYRSKLNEYYDLILQSLKDGMCRSDVYRLLKEKGYTGGQTAVLDYIKCLIKEHNIEVSLYRSSSNESITKKKSLQRYEHLSRVAVFRFLWMGLELTEYHKQYIFDEYPIIRELYHCIKEFRQIYEKHSMPLLYLFIEKYKTSTSKFVSTFVTGLEKDIEAVENSVASPLSNGFVEGTNSKVKMIKRTMYGRCSRELLSAKLICERPLSNG